MVNEQQAIKILLWEIENLLEYVKDPERVQQTKELIKSISEEVGNNGKTSKLQDERTKD